MTEQSQPPEAEGSEGPTSSWETVAPADAPAPEPSAVEAPAPVDAPAPLDPLPVEPATADGAPAIPEVVDPPVTVVPPAPAAAPSSRPEIAIGGAFAGGLAVALILKRLAR